MFNLPVAQYKKSGATRNFSMRESIFNVEYKLN